MNPNSHLDLTALQTALGLVAKGLRALSFYPSGHPARAESLETACSSLRPVLEQADLVLKVGRNSFTTSDGCLIADSGPVAALAFELFARQCSSLTILKDLYKEDLLELLRLLSVPPEQIQQDGGMDYLLSAHGVRTVWANELDLASIAARREVIETSEIRPEGLDDQFEVTDNSVQEQMPAEMQVEEPDGLDRVVARLAETADPKGYADLVERGFSLLKTVVQAGEFSIVIAFAGRLVADRDDAELGSVASKGVARLAGNRELLQTFIERFGAAQPRERRIISALLSTAGSDAVQILMDMLASEDRFLKREAAAQLATLGAVAIPALRAVLWDGRPELARSAVGVMGLIGDRSLVEDLKGCLESPDSTVIKEAVRSLAVIGGSEAEAALLALLEHGASEVLPQTIASLGSMRCAKALPGLAKIITYKDVLLKDLSMKQAAIEAVAAIGDPAILPALGEVLKRRPLVGREKWEQLQVMATHLIARLGDESMIPLLEKKVAKPGELGRACAEALAAIRRRGDKANATD